MSGTPKLVGENAIAYMDNILQKSHQIKVSYHAFILNISIVAGMALVITAFLYWRYRSKPSETEKRIQMMRDQEFVISKIRFFQEQNQKVQRMKNAEHFISGLPAFSESEKKPDTAISEQRYTPIVDLPPI